MADVAAGRRRRTVLAALCPLLLVGAGAAPPPPGAGPAPPEAAVVAPPAPDAPAAGSVAARRASPPVPGRVLRAFTPPATPYGAGHRGVALAAAPGDAVRAALPGVVRFSGVVAGRGWVTVDHGGGLDTTYGDLQPRLAAAGDRVDAGQVLGWLAPHAGHLHWGARVRGSYIDPLGLFGRWEPHLTE